MMSVSGDGAERLAEIFREMLALSESSQSDHSQSAVSDDSIESFDAHGVSGTVDLCGTQSKPSENKSRDA
jgi:hypothetical protein